jgi:Rod binding domain-containing protein
MSDMTVIAPAQGPAAATAATSDTGNLSPAQIAKVRQSAQSFEAMALGQLLQPMFNTVDTSKGMFGGGVGEATWKPMMVDEMAKAMARTGGVGIADAVFKEMIRMEAAKND